MSDSIVTEINRLRGMTVGQLRLEWSRLYPGQTTRSRNKEYLFKRACWRIQELRYGGLSDLAKQRLAQLAPAGFQRACPPRDFLKALDAAPPPATTTPPKTKRDARLPPPGSVISRRYRGRDLRLLVLDDGFELDGVRYGSLSEAARAVTGQHWNGKLFFGIVQRKRA